MSGIQNRWTITDVVCMGIAIAGIVLGEIAVLLDLGNRLFGSYTRTPIGALTRISLIILICIALGSPACFLFFHPESTGVQLWVYAFGLLGALVFVNFLLPIRFGVARSDGLNSDASTRELTKGVILREQLVELSRFTSHCVSLRILVISDLHCNNANKLKVIQNSHAELSDKEPDLVFVLGDFGENTLILPEVFAILGQLTSRFGTYCVRGNHDCEQGRDVLVQELAAANGITLLSNETKYLEEIDTLLVGLERPWVKTALPKITDASLVIALTHTPDNIALLDSLGVGVGFCGHTHGGKIRLPLIGPVLVPVWRGRFLASGWFSFGTCLMYITPGFGYFPGVFGNTGEVFRVSLTGSAMPSILE